MKFSMLKELVVSADSGTWGEEATTQNAYPVLRSNNIQDYRLTFSDIALRCVSEKEAENKKLLSGDILVTTSSGSPDLIGKCAYFIQPDDNKTYLYSNFTLRLRPNLAEANPRYLFHWLSSSQGRHQLGRMNSTTTGLRNLNQRLVYGI